MSKELRKIISIDENKCDGCGLCIPSCAEGALQIVDGKARLIKDIYCDGLGNCLGECPQGAIAIIEREAEPFDEAAVEAHLQEVKTVEEPGAACPASHSLAFGHACSGNNPVTGKAEAELSHWPIQLALVSTEARFLQGCDLLIAADCVPFALADFHPRLLAGRSLVIGCPKLDNADAYRAKLVEIFKKGKPRSVTVAHMEVGCCFGLSQLVQAAAREANIGIEPQELIVGVNGDIKSSEKEVVPADDSHAG